MGHSVFRKFFLSVYAAVGRPKVLFNCSQQTQRHGRYLSTVLDSECFTETLTKVPRTALKLPKDHTYEHVGMWYTLDPDLVHRTFSFGGITKKMTELNNIIQEIAFMIRKPALRVIDYVNQSDLSYPPNKFILYGRSGAGKTMSLAHIIHHFVEEEWVIVHVGVPVRWIAQPKEILPSATQEGFYDHTADSSLWLQQFKQQNETILTKSELVTSKTYQWTQREATEEGSPLLSIIDFGIARSKYGCDCIFHLFNELKRHAIEGKIKVAIVLDGINTYFTPLSTFKKEDGSLVPLENFTLFQAFKEFLRSDWKNGVIVGSVDISMSPLDRRESYLPRYLLRKKGWETLDPFLPIEVPDYSDKEFDSAVNYYLDRKWLQHPAGRTKEGKEELAFLSGRNPSELIKLINSL